MNPTAMEEYEKFWETANECGKLPRWDDLPELELYMDQVITLMNRYMEPFVHTSEPILTPSMINNYVKLNIMPKPNKKRYERIHMAYLIVITILKQILLIPQVKEGIFLQSKIDGISGAYNLFCQEQEQALQTMVEQYQQPAVRNLPAEPVPMDQLGLHMACHAFAGKIFTEKIIFLRMQEHLQNDKN